MTKKISDYCRKHENKIRTIIVFLIFLLTFLMYQYTEYSSDDFTFMNKWYSQEKIQSIQDIIYFQQQHYMVWGGRAVAHTFLQILFLIGKPLSALINAIGFILLGYLIYINALDKNEKKELYLLILGMLYYLNPIFQETISWYTGCANYMWTTILILAAIYPFLSYLKNDNYCFSKRQWAILPISFLAGWTNENMAPTMILVMLFTLFHMWKHQHKIHPYYPIATGLSVVGCLFLLLAPGNRGRSNSFDGGLMTIAYRGYGQISAWFNWLFPTILILLIVYFINKAINKNYMGLFQKTIFGWFVLSVLIMVASPTYPQRATFGSFVLLVVLIINITSHITVQNKTAESIVKTLCFMLSIGLLFVLFSTDVLWFVRSLGYYIPH